jgi:hypothetical protein
LSYCLDEEDALDAASVDLFPLGFEQSAIVNQTINNPPASVHDEEQIRE